MKYLSLVIVFAFLSMECSFVAPFEYKPCPAEAQAKMRGLSFVAPPRPFSFDPMPAIKNVKADWIAVIPYAFSRIGQTGVWHDTSNQHKWWGEKPEGVRKSIELAHEAGLQVMMKPQVYVPRDWTGGIEFETDEEWEEWEANYEKYLMIYVEIAEEYNLPLLCIGTEFEKSVVQREEFWRSLIAKVREKYSGQLTYAANWDGFENVTFWDELDYVGIDAYFPLIATQTPAVKDLKKAWKEPLKKIEKLYCRYDKPILFTEFGYLSVDGCAYKTWELEKQRKELSVNEQAQANALEALFEVFWEKDWWAGGFLWKWYPNRKGTEERIVKDYTPQGKIAEECLQKWYGMPE